MRRCIKIVLIVAYLAGQLAGMPHAHSADGTVHPADHSRPHVHLSWVDHEHHGHDHEYHDQDHGHEDDDHEHSGGQHPEPSSGHDSDAVYLPDGAGAPSVVSSVVKASDICLPATTPLAMCARMPAAPSENSPDDLFPGECSFGCPLYLALRALRL